MHYRCYFFGSSDNFAGFNEFDAKDDAEALIESRRLYAIHAQGVRWHFGFELWEGARLVHTEPKA